MQASPAPASTHRSRRRWLVPLVTVLCVAVLLIAFRTWMDRQLNAPVAPGYAAFLDDLANDSPQARAYRAAYLHRFARPTVAARHFEQVCATMLRMAESDGAPIPGNATAMAAGCRKHQPRYGGDALPRD